MANPAQESGWTLEILPRSAWWKPDLKELWRYRDLIALMTRRDITAQYKQTVLGPLWHVLQPLLTTFTFALIFGRGAGLAPPDLPSGLFYMSALVPWNFFANVVNRTSRTFTANVNVLSKVYFPRLAVPISTTISSLVSYAIQLATLAVFIAGYALFKPGFHFQLRPELLFLPLLVVIMTILGLGTGIAVSSMTTRYKDVGFVVGFGVQLLMYASPVILPLSRLQSMPWLLRVFEANPMTPIINWSRAILFGGPLDWNGLAYSCTCAALVLVFGMALFHHVERTFADTV